MEVWPAPRTIILGVRVQARLVWETVEDSATVPVNPFIGATVIVDMPVTPAETLTAVGLAETVKSDGGTVMVTTAV